MNSNTNRWLVSGVWLAALMAVVSASTQGALAIAAMWAMPAALAVTVACMGWPDKPLARVLGGIGLVWQLALVGAYWPFASQAAAVVSGPISWPMHSLLILGVLVLLGLSFMALFVLPALQLRASLQRATRALGTGQDDQLEAVSGHFRRDPALLHLWHQYLGQVRPTADNQGHTADCAHRSAREVFDTGTVTQSRLRLEFFRNLPGVFTGIGIIGTFSGLIMGLRSFRVSQDPGVVQRSLETLLSGVWEAFLISAVAITLAIVVTVIEKLVMSSIARHLEALAVALDSLYPPRPQADSPALLPQLIEALQAWQPGPRTAQHATPAAALQAPGLAATGAQARRAAGMTPVPAFVDTQPQPGLLDTALPLPSSAATDTTGLTAAVLQMAQHNGAATQALAELARGLPELLAQNLQGAAQGQAQAAQALKSLAGRLESVASGIEVAGRRTLETVAARLLQSEMHMVSRQQAVSEHLGELVQRIETLCGMLQQDRADMAQGGGLGRHAYGEHNPYDQPDTSDEAPSNGYATHWQAPLGGNGSGNGNGHSHAQHGHSNGNDGGFGS